MKKAVAALWVVWLKSLKGEEQDKQRIQTSKGRNIGERKLEVSSISYHRNISVSNPTFFARQDCRNKTRAKENEGNSNKRSIESDSARALARYLSVLSLCFLNKPMRASSMCRYSTSADIWHLRSTITDAMRPG